MTNPTESIERDFIPWIEGRDDTVIKNGVTLVSGGFAASDVSTGKTEFGNDAANLLPMGVVVGPADGDNELGLTGNSGGTKQVTTRGGIIERMAVTGASAISDKWKPVYATDGQVATLTKPSAGMAIGLVVKWISDTTCLVYLFSPFEAWQYSLMEVSGQIRFVVGSSSLGGTSAKDIITNLPMTRHFTIDSIAAQAIAIDGGVVAGSQTVSLEINSTPVTGGALLLLATSCDGEADLGVAIAGSAITAANEVHVGDTLSLLMAASGTAFTAAKSALFLITLNVTYKPGP